MLEFDENLIPFQELFKSDYIFDLYQDCKQFNNYLPYYWNQLDLFTYRIKDMFPRIKPFDTLNEFHDFTKLIPEKKTNNKEFNKQIYKAYKTMKIKNKKQRELLNIN